MMRSKPVPPLRLLHAKSHGCRAGNHRRVHHLRLVNDDNVGSFFHSVNGLTWTLEFSAEVSGYHHNIAGGFLSVRPALYVSGSGAATFTNLQYAGRNDVALFGDVRAMEWADRTVAQRKLPGSAQRGDIVERAVSRSSLRAMRSAYAPLELRALRRATFA